MVQQALGYLANEPVTGVEAALERVDAALATPNQEGVAVAQVRQARSVLQSGKVAAGRALLQASIAGALSQLDPAIGEDTGTSVVLDPLPPRAALTGLDRAFLAGSLLVLIAGLILAYRFRPPENLRALRLRLGRKHRGPVVPPKHGRPRGRK